MGNNNEDDYLGKDILDNELNSKNHKALKKFIINSKNIARTGTKLKTIILMELLHLVTIHQYLKSQ